MKQTLGILILSLLLVLPLMLLSMRMHGLFVLDYSEAIRPGASWIDCKDPFCAFFKPLTHA